MRKNTKHAWIMALAMLLATVLMLPAAFAESVDAQVQKVISMLEEIDSLQEMQDKRYTYTVSNRSDTGTTSSSILAAHDAARTGYETYVELMFAKRGATRKAYEALSASQQAQIDSALVKKLTDTLSTKFNSSTGSVSPTDTGYVFEAVKGARGYAYEVSNYMVAGNIPQTFVLVDTSDGKTSWTPSGRYQYGGSNYEVTYCCDVETPLHYNNDYRRINLEDSNYYGPEAASHIRAILQISYPYVSMSKMKSNLIASGMNAEVVNSLNRADLIAGVQGAIWTYANAADMGGNVIAYFASIDITKNQGTYFTALHDYTNEMWEWLPGARGRSLDKRAQYRVDSLIRHLCSLPGVAPSENQIVISDVSVTRASLQSAAEEKYDVGLNIFLNAGAREGDKLKITVTSYRTNADGTKTVTSTVSQPVGDAVRYDVSVTARYDDVISVVVEGTQVLAKGVYFYEPQGGRDASQSLVGVADGETAVYAEEHFTFHTDVEKGLRIHKTEYGTGLPISGITFTVYKLNPGDNITIGSVPTTEDVAKYAVEENKVASVTTDVTGYASLALEDGTYLIVEEKSDKVKTPVAPFFILVPMVEENTVQSGDGTVTTTYEAIDVISVYPKNTLKEDEDEEEPVIPPVPDDVKGKFSIYKYDAEDENKGLDGAQFQVYRPALEGDSNVTVITCDGVEYAVTPVKVNGVALILSTGKNGTATSPKLDPGTYFLVETLAPDGYYLKDEVYSVKISLTDIDSVPVVRVSNQHGSILPQTGGSGITWMWMSGCVLMLGAAVVLLARKRAY